MRRLIREWSERRADGKMHVVRRYVQKRKEGSAWAMVESTALSDRARFLFDKCKELTDGEFELYVRVRDPMEALGPCGAVAIGKAPVSIQWRVPSTTATGLTVCATKDRRRTILMMLDAALVQIQASKAQEGPSSP